MTYLTVVENAEEYCVVYEDSDDDWVVKYKKSWVEAKDWAFHMVSVHNERVYERAFKEGCDMDGKR